jgi:hypothetical protein
MSVAAAVALFWLLVISVFLRGTMLRQLSNRSKKQKGTRL